MKDEHILMLAFAAMVLFMATRKKTTATANTYDTTEITPDGDANGWRYFSDGVAIGPDGNYYKNGKLIYNGVI